MVWSSTSWRETRWRAISFSSRTAEERAVVDKALITTYKDFGFTVRKRKFDKIQQFPLLKDFYKTLKKMKQKDLCHRLDKFVTGSLSTVFNAQTNVNLDNRLVGFLERSCG